MKPSLLSLFEQSETELRNQLIGIELPRDNEKLNHILSNLFVEHIKVDEYKQELTSSELAIFQSAIQLVEESLHLQKEIFSFEKIQESVTSHAIAQIEEKKLPINKSQVAVVGVTAMGILAGAVPNWGTIIFAIIATAIGVVVTKEYKDTKTIVKEKVVCPKMLVNADVVINVTKQICQSVDKLMAVYQTNIENLKSRLDNKPEPTLYNSYGYLLNRLADLYKDQTNNASKNEIENDITKLFKTLKNYNYEFVNFSDETKQYYEVEEIDEISEPEIDAVAVLEKGECIIKGKYYLPKK